MIDLLFGKKGIPQAKRDVKRGHIFRGQALSRDFVFG